MQGLSNIAPEEWLPDVAVVSNQRSAVISDQVMGTSRIREDYDTTVDHERHIGLTFVDQSVELRGRSIRIEADGQ